MEAANETQTIGNGQARSTTDAIRELKQDVTSQVSDQYRRVERQARDIAQASMDMFNRHPVYFLLGISAVGFLAGFALKRINRVSSKAA